MFRNRKKRPDVIQTARGQRIFAIGDIHGRYDLLEQILDEVLSRFKSPHHFGKANRLIFLGDIDFGERLKQAIPEKYTKMLEDAPTTLRSGDYLFVHAGVKPGVPLANQENFDLFFIRDEFTQSQDWHGAMVVHGHTIVEKVEQHPNRIAIDTGAYRSGRLSCLVLNGQKREIFTT